MTKPGKMMVNITPPVIDPVAKKAFDDMAKANYAFIGGGQYNSVIGGQHTFASPPRDAFPTPRKITCPFCDMVFQTEKDEGECPECKETWLMGTVEEHKDTFIQGVLWDNGEDITLAEQKARKAIIPPPQKGFGISSFLRYGPIIKSPNYVFLNKGGT